MVLFSTSALAEDKSITPKEFANNISQVPEIWPWNVIFKGKDNE